MTRIEVDGKSLEVSEEDRSEFDVIRTEYRNAVSKVKSVAFLSVEKARMRKFIDGYLLNIEEQRNGADADLLARIDADLKELAGSFNV